MSSVMVFTRITEDVKMTMNERTKKEKKKNN